MSITKEGDLYRVGNLIVAPNPPQDFIAGFYLKMKAEGSLEVFCYEKVPVLSDFLFHFVKPGVLSLGAFLQRESGETELAGMGRVGVPVSIADGKYTKAEIDIGFLKPFQRRRYTIPFAQTMLEWVFDRTTIDGLYGTTPEPNSAMIRFIDALGFKRIKEPVENFSVCQGEPCGVYISWLTKDRWRAVSPFQVSSNNLATSISMCSNLSTSTNSGSELAE